MSTEANVMEPRQGESKLALVAEPLVFRNLEESNSLLADVLTDPQESVPQTPLFDLEASLQSAREQGRREALEAARAGTEQRISAEREAVKRTLQQFEHEKQRYFSDVEQEVVKLSLAIAERVLNRESAMDPTLLAGAARVALEQVADSSEVVLRVCVEEAERWAETMKSTSPGMVIEVHEDMPCGECVLKTSSGSVQLGLRAQLQEIERGFFELLGQRPGFAAAGA